MNSRIDGRERSILWLALGYCSGLLVCVLNRFSCVWLFVTLWAVAHQTPLSVGFSRQECWSELPYPPPGDLPDPGIELVCLCLLHWQGGSLPLAPPGKPITLGTVTYSTNSSVSSLSERLANHQFEKLVAEWF